jgi:quinol-cytochrome oxidoreductase complex cytochrome b subunit
MSSSATSGSTGRHDTGHDTNHDEEAHRAGAFDIRTFIGALIGIYGVVLTIVGAIGPSDSQLAKSDDVNINLWAGIVMILVAIGFIAWARLRPVVVPEHVETDDDRPAAH